MFAYFVPEPINNHTSLYFMRREDSSTASKMRHAVRFRWTHSMLGADRPEARQDAAFEMANVLVNVALWHMKHAAMIAAKDE